MNSGKYTFVVDISPNFERDVLEGASPQFRSMSMLRHWCR
jgi:hypothetical protein